MASNSSNTRNEAIKSVMKKMPDFNYVLKFIILMLKRIQKFIEIEFNTLDGNINFVCSVIAILVIFCVVIFKGFQSVILAFWGIERELPNIYLIAIYPFLFFFGCICILRFVLKK